MAELKLQIQAEVGRNELQIQAEVGANGENYVLREKREEGVEGKTQKR